MMILAESQGEKIIVSELRLERYVLQSVARMLAPNERVARCLRALVYKQEQVDLYHSPTTNSAHYANLVTCASVWHCPVCASKISERRRLELQPFVDHWQEWFGGSVVLLTLTMRHKSHEPLRLVLKAMVTAATRLRSGKGWSLLCNRFGYVGLVRALELTYGKNGWHPHMHALIFFSQRIDVAAFSHEIKQRWRRMLLLQGRSCSYERGADVRFVDGFSPSYLTKMGLAASLEGDDLATQAVHWTAAHELAKASVKLGRNGSLSPMQMLRLAAKGEAEAAKRWQEYAFTLKGHNHLVWSKGFRQYLGLLPQKTDRQLVDQQDKMAVLLAQIEFCQWQEILRQELRGQILEVASSGDVVALEQWLDNHGIYGVKFPDNILNLDLQEDLQNE